MLLKSSKRTSKNSDIKGKSSIISNWSKDSSVCIEVRPKNIVKPNVNYNTNLVISSKIAQILPEGLSQT